MLYCRNPNGLLAVLNPLHPAYFLPVLTSRDMNLPELVEELRAQCEQIEAQVNNLRQLVGGTTQAGSSAPDAQRRLREDDSWEHYNRCRSYIDSQATWINARLTWLLTIEGFFFASYTLAFQTIGTLTSNCARGATLDWLSFFAGCLLPILGALVSVCGLAGTSAGRYAINGTHWIWDHRLKIPQEIRDVAPMKGGCAPKKGESSIMRRRINHHVVHFLGYLPPIGLPILILVVWLVLFFYYPHFSYGIVHPPCSESGFQSGSDALARGHG